MAGRIRTFDWATTPLGPAELWSDRLRVMVEQVLASPLVATLVCGPERSLIYNDAAVGLFGDHHPAALGRPLPKTFPEGWATVAPFYERAFAGETVQVADQPLDTRGEGAATDVFDALLVPVRETDGSVAYVHMTGAEVGDRVRTEAARRESETRHRLLIGSWAQAVWETDAHGAVVADSPSWRAYTGQTRQEWFGYGWLDAIHPDDRGYAERQWRETVAAGGLVDAEFRLRAADGGWRWTNVRAAPVLDAGGTIEKWVGLNIDIDARKRAEAALRGSEQRYRSLFGSMDEAYAVVEVLKDGAGRWADFRFLEANHAFVKHTSMPHPVGRTATELLGAPNPRWTELYGRALDTGEPIRIEETEPALGRTFDLNIFALDRARNHVAVLFTDITARKRAEIMLREREERQAFLLKLSDALRPIGNVQALRATACRMLGERLSASRVYYMMYEREAGYGRVADDYLVEGMSSLAGQYPFEAFRATYDRIADGTTWIVPDVTAATDLPEHERKYYASQGVIAWVNVPLAKDGMLEAAFCIVQSAPRSWTAVEIALVEETAERLWSAIQRGRAEEQLRESEERFAQFAASSSDALWIRNAGTLAMEYTSPAIATIYGVAPDVLLGDPARWLALILPEDRDEAALHWETARQGEPITHEFRIVRPSDGQTRWIRNTDFPLRDERGGVRRIGGIAEDVTEGKRAIDRQEVLINELQHRARNPLGVITAVPGRTLRLGGSVAAFEDRLQALSRAQGLLSQFGSDTVEIGALVRAELAAHSDLSPERVRIDGPAIHLTAQQVQNFALALHELTTNAVKYGALQDGTGHLAVAWEVALARRGRRLALSWIASGVPVGPDAASRRGYGTELIQEALAYALQAKVDYVLGADGVRCRIEMPVT